MVLWRMGTVAFPVRRRRMVEPAPALAAAGPDPSQLGLSESWSRLGHELADSPSGETWRTEDLDSWVGQPDGFAPPTGGTSADGETQTSPRRVDEDDHRGWPDDEVVDPVDRPPPEEG